mgnify:CR=1 FL=1
MGASGEVGRATATKLALAGINLCLVYRERRSAINELEKHHSELKQTGVKLLTYNSDALNESVRNSIVEELKTNGPVQVVALVHAIAKGTLKNLTGENRASLEDYQITQHAMAYSLVDWVNAGLDHDLFVENASVIAIDSAGSQRYIPQYGIVGATKASLIKLTQDLAIELVPKRIRCNVIRAGVMDSKALNAIPASDLIKNQALKSNPNGRLTLGEDVANAIYLLSLSESSWITGSIINVDGGEGYVGS